MSSSLKIVKHIGSDPNTLKISVSCLPLVGTSTFIFTTGLDIASIAKNKDTDKHLASKHEVKNNLSGLLPLFSSDVTATYVVSLLSP